MPSLNPQQGLPSSPSTGLTHISLGSAVGGPSGKSTSSPFLLQPDIPTAHITIKLIKDHVSLMPLDSGLLGNRLTNIVPPSFEILPWFTYLAAVCTMKSLLILIRPSAAKKTSVMYICLGCTSA